MPPRRSEGEESKNPFFEGDGSSFDECGDYGVADDDYKGSLVFDDDQYEEEIVSGDVGVNLMFREELKMGDDVFVLIRKEVVEGSEIPEAMIPLLKEFSDVFPDELLDELPPLCDIQYHFDLEHGSQLPNRPHYIMSQESMRSCIGRFPIPRLDDLLDQISAKKIGSLEIVEKINSNSYRLKLPSHIRCSDVKIVKNLLPYHGDSSDDDLVGNSRTNFVYPWGNDAGPSVEEQALLFLEESQFPVLTAMARDLLTIQASTIASKSAFSISGSVLSIRRTRLTQASLEMCICFKDHLDAAERIQHISSLEDELDIEQDLHDGEVEEGFAISLSDKEIALDEAASEARSEVSEEELTLEDALN
ncbi:putative reverse transcriptase domain-containing protein [Tanacetum coccineum]